MRGLSGTKPGSLPRTEIPIRTDNWDITHPGFPEADTVAHCGHSLAGKLPFKLLGFDNDTFGVFFRDATAGSALQSGHSIDHWYYVFAFGLEAAQDVAQFF